MDIKDLKKDLGTDLDGDFTDEQLRKIADKMDRLKPIGKFKRAWRNYWERVQYLSKIFE